MVRKKTVNDGSRHCSSAARLISDSLTPVVNLRDTVVGFIFFLLLSALEVYKSPASVNKKLSRCRGAARRDVSVEI